MFHNKLFEQFPFLEVTVKNIYGRSTFVSALVQRLLKIKKPNGKSSRSLDAELEKVLSKIRAYGVRQGDILIVHSSMNSLKATGCSPDEIIDGLLSIVGDTGTLALPAFAIFHGEPVGTAKFDDSKYNIILDYDRNSSSIWTGVLAKRLLARTGAMRSPHPLNSLVALGSHADEMMSLNLSSPNPTPCGPGSAWEHCYQKNAKIVALGVDLAHSLTMIHVAEDAFEQDWPVRDWYHLRRYRITDGTTSEILTVRARKHKWSIFYAERAFARDLIADSVAQYDNVDGIDMWYCESKKLVNYLRSKNSIGYPYNFFPYPCSLVFPAFKWKKK